MHESRFSSWCFRIFETFGSENFEPPNHPGPEIRGAYNSNFVNKTNYLLNKEVV